MLGKNLLCSLTLILIFNYVCACTCMYVCVCAHICACVHMYVHVCIYVRVCIYVHVCIYIRVCIRACMHACACACRGQRLIPNIFLRIFLPHLLSWGLSLNLELMNSAWLPGQHIPGTFCLHVPSTGTADSHHPPCQELPPPTVPDFLHWC